MKRFRFRLESVLTVRKLREQEALRALAAAQRAHQQEIARRAAHVKALENGLRGREALSSGSSTIESFYVWQQFIDGQKIRIQQAEHAILRAQRSVEKAMRTYLHTRQRTEAISRLKEKDLAVHKREQNLLEQKKLDDMVVMRHNRPGLTDEEDAA